MNEHTGIEWTDATWNPVTGCTKVSRGCKNCYAERIFNRPYPGRAFTDVRCHEDRLTQPLKWTKGRRIFVNSMSDLFHEDVPFEFIDRVFSVMACTTRHTYQVLTKRPARMLEWFTKHLVDETSEIPYAEECSVGRKYFHPKQVDTLAVWPQWTPHIEGKRGGYDNCGPGWPLSNVWLGVSVEDQETADERIPLLLKIPDGEYSDGTANCWTRFLSCEPLLGPIDLTGEHLADKCGGEYPFPTLPREHRTTRLDLLDWVIAGGESGPNARPSHPDWFRSLRDQCGQANVAFFFKQYGEWRPCGLPIPHTPSAKETVLPDGMAMVRMGKRASGRILDGRTHDEFPETV